MKMIICAGPPTSGKTTVLKQTARRLLERGRRLAYLKIDVQFADEDELFRASFGIPARKLYSGDLCPDHCSVLVLGDAVKWAADEGADTLFVETAGLCLRCAPYIEGALGIVVLEATSGMNLPRKIGAMLSLADLAVVTKIDLVSQAEKEVFRANITDAAPIDVIEADALHGIGIDRVVTRMLRTPDLSGRLMLKGSPPVATCTICAGKRDIGWEHHFGVLRTLESDLFYRGQ
ncbi:MAG: cobalamin biosynthesis protein [Rubrivivax sp.]|nr:cobalamin biosynthesis protein [Rubrivivax sp.]